MDWVLVSLKWLSQILIVTSGVVALFAETYKTDPVTGRRSLQRAGWLTILAIVVGFLVFGFSDIQERTAAKEAANAQEIQAKNQAREIEYLQNLILMQEKLAGLEVELEFPRERLSQSLKPFEGLPQKAYFSSAARYGSITAVTDEAGRRSLHLQLARPQGMLSLHFDEQSAEWEAFKKALSELCPRSLSLNLTTRVPLLKGIIFPWPSRAAFVGGKVVLGVRNPDIKLVYLKNASVQMRIEGEDKEKAPTRVTIRSLDPGVKLDTAIVPDWKRQATEVIGQEGEPIELPYFIDSHPLRADLAGVLRYLQ
jgi:hypothetical protein